MWCRRARRGLRRSASRLRRLRPRPPNGWCNIAGTGGSTSTIPPWRFDDGAIAADDPPPGVPGGVDRVSAGVVDRPPHSCSGASGLHRRGKLQLQDRHPAWRSEEHTSELQSLMRISYAVFCLKKKKNKQQIKQSE